MTSSCKIYMDKNEIILDMFSNTFLVLQGLIFNRGVIEANEYCMGIYWFFLANQIKNKIINKKYTIIILYLTFLHVLKFHFEYLYNNFVDY